MLWCWSAFSCISVSEKPGSRRRGNSTASTFHTAMCTLICCWNACYCIHQHTYSSGLFIHFGWCGAADEEMVRSLLNSIFLFFTSKHSPSLPQPARVSSVLPAPGSAPMRLRRAALTSVASGEECDECCLYRSDSSILAWFKPRRSAPPWCLGLRLMFILRWSEMGLSVFLFSCRYFKHWKHLTRSRRLLCIQVKITMLELPRWGTHTSERCAPLLTREVNHAAAITGATHTQVSKPGYVHSWQVEQRFITRWHSPVEKSKWKNLLQLCSASLQRNYWHPPKSFLQIPKGAEDTVSTVPLATHHSQPTTLCSHRSHVHVCFCCQMSLYESYKHEILTSVK